jgi:hypothetical protein
MNSIVHRCYNTILFIRCTTGSSLIMPHFSPPRAHLFLPSAAAPVSGTRAAALPPSLPIWSEARSTSEAAGIPRICCSRSPSGWQLSETVSTPSLLLLSSASLLRFGVDYLGGWTLTRTYCWFGGWTELFPPAMTKIAGTLGPKSTPSPPASRPACQVPAALLSPPVASHNFFPLELWRKMVAVVSLRQSPGSISRAGRRGVPPGDAREPQARHQSPPRNCCPHASPGTKKPPTACSPSTSPGSPR